MVFCRLPEGLDVPSDGPCMFPATLGSEATRAGVTGAREDRTSRWAALGFLGQREQFFSRPPGGSTGHRELTSSPVPQLWDTQAPTASPETPASPVTSFVNTIY